MALSQKQAEAFVQRLRTLWPTGRTFENPVIPGHENPRIIRTDTQIITVTVKPHGAARILTVIWGAADGPINPQKAVIRSWKGGARFLTPPSACPETVIEHA